MRLIDADKMAVEESDAYLFAQSRIKYEITRIVSAAVHTKIQQLIADTPTVDAAEVLRNQWISVEERLPDKEGKYLVTIYDRITPTVLYFYKRYPYCNRGIRTDRPVWCDYDNYGYGDFEEKSVTHWMPLPEPPEGGKP